MLACKKRRKSVKELPFVIMCLLLASMGTAYGTDPIHAKITNPPNGSIVLIPIEVEITLENISAEQDLWICVYPLNVKRYYIQDKRFLTTSETMGHLSMKAFVGTNDSWGSKFSLFLVGADGNANKAIIEYLTKSNAQRSWLGLENLPDGAFIYDTINVTRA